MSWRPGPDYEMYYAPDRASRALTGPPRSMHRSLPPMPERASIFGDTYNGVPNPLVPVAHGYPTRFHGPIFVWPQPGYEYAPATYAKAPFLGFGQAEAGITTKTILFIGAGAALFWAIANDRGKLAGMKPSTAAMVGGAAAALLVSM